MKRCFVISPIGPEGSAIREHADDVFEYVIKPAMEELNIHPVRSDHLQEPGRITEQMFQEILNDDLSIAILTGHNANVFYELAIAHAAERPVITLILKGEALPFDVMDLRCVHYDLKPRPLFDKVYAKELIAHVRAFEASGWKASNVLGRSLRQPSGSLPENSYPFYRNGAEFGTQETWLKLIDGAERVVELMGIHLGPWRSKEFSEAIAEKARKGCQIRILVMHPDNPALPTMINESLTDVDLECVVREIQEMTKYYSRIAANCPNVSFRQIQRGTLHCQSTRTDGSAMYLPYLYARRRRNCPLWQCEAHSPLYDVVADEFEGLWNANDPATAP